MIEDDSRAERKARLELPQQSSSKKKEPQKAQKAQTFLCALSFVWYFPLPGAAELFLEQPDLLFHGLLWRRRNRLYRRLRRTDRLLSRRFPARPLVPGFLRSCRSRTGLCSRFCRNSNNGRFRFLPPGGTRRLRQDGLHRKADPLHGGIHADHFHLHNLTDFYGLPRVLNVFV